MSVKHQLVLAHILTVNLLLDCMVSLSLSPQLSLKRGGYVKKLGILRILLRLT